MIKRRKFLKISALGAGTIAATSGMALGEKKGDYFGPVNPPEPFVPNYEDITDEELKSKNDFVSKYLVNLEKPLFSFIYDQMDSTSLMKAWTFEKEQKQLDEFKKEHILKWNDPSSGIEVQLIAVEYIKYPTLEWTIYFKNNGKENTRVFEKIKALDIYFNRIWEEACDLRLENKPESEFILYSNTGDNLTNESFSPHRKRLEYITNHHFAPIGGRPTNGTLPYFNLQWRNKAEGDKEGLIMSVGWPGQWSADFERDESTKCTIKAGQEITHLKLMPGETIRTPLMTLQFYKGTSAHGQNIWRRWMIEHNLKRRKGKVLEPFTSACIGMPEIDKYNKEKCAADYFWMDAGWYQWPDDKKGWEVLATGTWEPDPKAFPDGLKVVSEKVHSKGWKLILWFEPERVSPGRAWAEKKEWLLNVSNSKRVFRWENNWREQRFIDDEAKRNQLREGDSLFNLGIPEAREFLTDFISKKITEYKIDFYRQDFNFSPLEFWNEADASDRQGITENKYVTGLLLFWDDLLKRHPDIWIDTCASGGRRIDLESLRRAYPLTRTDFQFQANATQNHSYGLASWVPFSGTGSYSVDMYHGRSYMLPSYELVVPASGSGANDFDLYRRLMAEWRQINPYFSGDYYPLTSFSFENDIWMAWQFHRPDLNEGFLQIFRRGDSPFTSAKFKLNGLKENQNYTIVNFDQKGKTVKSKGLELMKNGLNVEINSAPGSAIIVYKKA